MFRKIAPQFDIGREVGIGFNNIMFSEHIVHVAVILTLATTVHVQSQFKQPNILG